MKNNVFFRLYQSFKKTNGFAITLIGTVITFIGFYIKPNFKIDVIYLIPVVSFLIIIFITIIDALITQFNDLKRILPKVLFGTKPPKIINNSIALLLTENSPVFGHESLVCVYFKEESYEVLIGIGYVFNIQEDGRIQIAIVKNMSEDISIWEKIKNNDSNQLKKIIIKPGIKFINDLNSSEE